MTQNLCSALTTAYQFVQLCLDNMSNKGFGVPLDVGDFNPAFLERLQKAGLAINSLLADINNGIQNAVVLNDNNLPRNYVYQVDVSIMQTILEVRTCIHLNRPIWQSLMPTIQNFNAMPDENSLLAVRMELFTSSNATDYDLVNQTEYLVIANEVITSNARPALWFYVAGGMVLVTLALMCLINRWPRGTTCQI